MTPQEHQKNCQEYQNSRQSPYWLRCIRYQAVADKLIELGLQPNDSVYDIGAGKQEFGPFLKAYAHWNGLYIPVDGLLDGTNLDFWSAPFPAEFAVAIEVLEHLQDPIGMAIEMDKATTKGCVITTPNPRTVDVLGCDPTHISIVYPQHLEDLGWYVEEMSLFLKPRDSLLGWFS